MANLDDLLSVLGALITQGGSVPKGMDARSAGQYGMKAQRVDPGLYDPTGMSFDHAEGGTSSELGSIEKINGKYALVPLLVPGQVGLEALLSGKPIDPKLRQEMGRRAVEYAKTRLNEVPMFDTLDEALTYESTRHEGLNKDYAPHAPQDALSALLMALPSR